MSKRKTFMAGRLDKPLRSPEHEVAKWVKSAADAYLRERAPASSLTEAVENWLAVCDGAGKCPDCAWEMRTRADVAQHRPAGRCVFAEDPDEGAAREGT